MSGAFFTLPPGTFIGENNRYKLLKAVGLGGFGVTYIAWDCLKGCNVAVKECFPKEICVRDQATGKIKPKNPEQEAGMLKVLESMLMEIRSLQSLDHEAIVHIHDSIPPYFYVMDYLKGGSLKDKLLSEHPLSVELSIHYLRRLLGALGYLHQHNIIHRDIRPENIMFNDNDEPVIIDFGAALDRGNRTIGAMTTQGAHSMDFCAIEQLSAGKIGPWTDFYALSAVWYLLLTGQVYRPQATPSLLDAGVCKVPYPHELLVLLQRNLSIPSAVRCQSVEDWYAAWPSGW